jgi:hypothetical protein
MRYPRYPAGCTAEEHDEVFGSSDPFDHCASCGEEIEERSRTMVEVGEDTFCNNACRANKVYEACENATAKAEYKRLVAALSMLAGIHLDRIPALDKYDMGVNVVLKEDGHPFHVIDLDDVQKDVRALLAQIGDFADETPKWSQDAIESAEDCAAIIGDQVTNG